MDQNQKYVPRSLAEASSLLKDKEGVFLKGGGSRLGERHDVEGVVELSTLGLNYIDLIDTYDEVDSDVAIGATTPLSRLGEDPHIKEFAAGLLAEAVGTRSEDGQATMGGELATGTSRSPIIGSLLALEAIVRVFTGTNIDWRPVEALYDLEGEVYLGPGEIIEEIVLPAACRRGKSALVFGKNSRTGVALYLEGTGEIERVHLSVFTEGRAAQRLDRIEALLIGQPQRESSLDFPLKFIGGEIFSVEERGQKTELVDEVADLVRTAFCRCIE